LRAGQTTLVVHHSNTIPRIMEALGVITPPSIGDTEFDWLFIVTFEQPGRTRLLTLHYGD
jgi:hypothetical protein